MEFVTIAINHKIWHELHVPTGGPSLGCDLYESLTRFRRLLENGPKYKNKDELPYLRKRSGCFGAFRSILSFEF